MNYIEYLHTQSQIERLYDFHPDFFKDLEPTELSALSKGFLYDVDDDLYPDSIKQYYEQNINTNKELQNQMLSAAQRLYDLSGSGSLEDSMKNIVSFSGQ